jgi:signal transduction histidine kinase
MEAMRVAHFSCEIGAAPPARTVQGLARDRDRGQRSRDRRSRRDLRPVLLDQDGTGLGLDVVWRVVTDHGGTLDASSRPGETTFRIELPRSATVS